jgi:MraZ protein
VGLSGIIEKRIDPKGRISIPKRLRDQLVGDGEEEVTLLKLDNCLQLYPRRMWSKIQDKIEQLSPFDQQTRQLQRFWGMRTDEILIDIEGRLTLTRDQKQYAGILEDVVIVGAMNKVEIWSLERHRALTGNAPDVETMANEIAMKLEK